MILRPRFHAPAPVDRAAGRRALGLDPDRPTGLVLFGGHGSRAMVEVARRAARCARPLQLIFICGRNDTLAGRLRSLELPYPRFVEGFTAEVPRYMQLADFFVGKPGPGSISEALAMGLPVIVARNAWTLPQERYNADWVRAGHLGLVVASFRRVEQAIDRLLDPEQLAGFRVQVAALENRAVYEIPGILARLL